MKLRMLSSFEKKILESHEFRQPRLEWRPFQELPDGPDHFNFLTMSQWLNKII